MNSKPEKTPGVESAILTIRGVKVILDADLARLYGVPTKRLNEQVRRNAEKFPPDFLFQLAAEEVKEVANRSQTVTGSVPWMRSQNATASKRNIGAPPYAFTEHGAIMAATVLNSPQAVQMSVFVVRAFVKMREQLQGRAEMETRLAEIERTLLSHDAALRDLYHKIRPLLLPPPEAPRKLIGFQVKEPRARYSAKKGRPR